MKTNRLKKMMLVVLGFASMLFIMSSCSQDDEVQLGKEDLNAKITPEDQEKIDFLVHNLGFYAESIAIEDSFFVVEKDICFSKKDFWEKYDKEKTTNDISLKSYYKHELLVTAPYRKIHVKTYGTVPQDWLVATLQAIDEWNSLNGAIKFTVNPLDNPTSELYIAWTSITNRSDVYAKAEFPQVNGRPGAFVRINSTCTLSTTERKRKWVMVHELGHCIGLRHTTSNYESERIEVPMTGLSCDESESIMHPLNTPYSFTECDKKLYKDMYK